MPSRRAYSTLSPPSGCAVTFAATGRRNLSGILSLVSAVLVLAWPGASALALVWMIGAYAISTGARAQRAGLAPRRADGPSVAPDEDVHRATYFMKGVSHVTRSRQVEPVQISTSLRR
ncbi:DUF308 domain-containing protein [Paraburkholderia terrae]